MRRFKIGHLFFKYVQGTPLEYSLFNTSMKLAAELQRRGLIKLYHVQQGGLVPTDSAKLATWYGYNKALVKYEVIAMLSGG